MAELRPFASIRPCKGKAAKIAALPYDVYSREEAARIVEKNPDTFLKIDRAETQFPLSVGMYDEKVYERAHDTLMEMIAEGSFVREEKKCFYLYELTMNGRVQTGIVACAAIEDYLSGVIKKHENTRADKEEDRIRHVDACNAQTGPIFLAYRADARIGELTKEVKQQEAEYDFVSEDGIRHRVFVIGNEALIAEIERVFAGIDSIYIADGHHRAASAVKVGLKRREQNPSSTGEEEFNYFLSVLFPDEELMILDYNRLVRDLNGYSAEEFYQEVSRRFEVTALENNEEKRPGKRGCFTMYLEGRWFLCRIKPEDRKPQDVVADLDVSVLQDRLLFPVLGICDPRTDKRIDFVGGIRGMEELERRCNEDCAVAFAMYPTSIGELFAVADAGRLMPPKSTWFEPKLRSGLLIHEI
ncbi:MAG: DUF1015 domain-containing protein [Roseburia sp.]